MQYFFHRDFLVDIDISLSSHQFFCVFFSLRFHAKCVNEYMLSLILPATSRSARNHSRRNFTATKSTAVTSSAINRPDTTDTSHSRSFYHATSIPSRTLFRSRFSRRKIRSHQRVDSTIPVHARIRQLYRCSRKIKRVSS